MKKLYEIVACIEKLIMFVADVGSYSARNTIRLKGNTGDYLNPELSPQL
jgi:hypothetical protein